MSNICYFWFLNVCSGCFFLIYDNKWCVIGFQTVGWAKETIWRRHLHIALTDQVNGSLVEGGRLQDLLHGDRLQFVRVELLTLVRYAVVHDHRQRTHARLLIVRPPFLKEETERDVTLTCISLLPTQKDSSSREGELASLLSYAVCFQVYSKKTFLNYCMYNLLRVQTKSIKYKKIKHVLSSLAPS